MRANGILGSVTFFESGIWDFKFSQFVTEISIYYFMIAEQHFFFLVNHTNSWVHPSRGHIKYRDIWKCKDISKITRHVYYIFLASFSKIRKVSSPSKYIYLLTFNRKGGWMGKSFRVWSHYHFLSVAFSIKFYSTNFIKI